MFRRLMAAAPHSACLHRVQRGHGVIYLKTKHGISFKTGTFLITKYPSSFPSIKTADRKTVFTIKVSSKFRGKQFIRIYRVSHKSVYTYFHLPFSLVKLLQSLKSVGVLENSENLLADGHKNFED